MRDEKPLHVDIIPFPNIEAGFVLVLRYRGGRKDTITYRDHRYRLKRWISSSKVAELIGASEDFLLGVEQAMSAAAVWSTLTWEERREWIGPY